jgi:hypothetical protein
VVGDRDEPGSGRSFQLILLMTSGRAFGTISKPCASMISEISDIALSQIEVISLIWSHGQQA